MLLTSTRLFIIVSRALVESYYRRQRITVPDLANQFNINKRALSPVMHQLTRVGILASQTGGKSPGFIFAKDPKEIDLADIIIAAQGEFKMQPCRDVLPDILCVEDNCMNCMVNKQFNFLLDQSKSALKNVTMYSLYESALQNQK